MTGCVKAYQKYLCSRQSMSFQQYGPKSYSQCETMCTGSGGCKGFGYNNVTDTCFMSSTKSRTDLPHSPQWTFSEKICASELFSMPDDTVCAVITTSVITTTQTTSPKTTTEMGTTIPAARTQQRGLVSLESPPTTTTTQTTSQKTTTEIGATIPSAGTQQHGLVSMESPTTTSVITTSQTTSQKTTTEIEATTIGPIFKSSYCTCVCKETNTTVSERIATRKLDLELDVRKLSAFTRKLTSAPDYRPSSVRIGYVGITIIIIWGLFIALFDILRFVIAFKEF